MHNSCLTCCTCKCRAEAFCHMLQSFALQVSELESLRVHKSHAGDSTSHLG